MLGKRSFWARRWAASCSGQVTGRGGPWLTVGWGPGLGGPLGPMVPLPGAPVLPSVVAQGGDGPRLLVGVDSGLAILPARVADVPEKGVERGWPGGTVLGCRAREGTLSRAGGLGGPGLPFGVGHQECPGGAGIWGRSRGGGQVQAALMSPAPGSHRGGAWLGARVCFEIGTAGSGLPRPWQPGAGANTGKLEVPPPLQGALGRGRGGGVRERLSRGEVRGCWAPGGGGCSPSWGRSSPLLHVASPRPCEPQFPRL